MQPAADDQVVRWRGSPATPAWRIPDASGGAGSWRETGATVAGTPAAAPPTRCPAPGDAPYPGSALSATNGSPARRSVASPSAGGGAGSPPFLPAGPRQSAGPGRWLPP